MKLFRKGEFLYRAGEPVSKIYLVQTGLVSLTVARGSQSFELSQAIAPQIVGEESLWGATHWSTNAVAVNDTRVVEVPLGLARQFIEAIPGAVKLVAKSMIEKQRGVFTEISSIKLEQDPTPCPPDCVTQLFAVIYQVATYTGTAKNGMTVVVWPSFKKYCQRNFLESPVRLEQAVNILVKLGFARLEMVKSETDPEAPDELGFVHFQKLEQIKGFFEFYRKHFHGGTLKQLLQDESAWSGEREVYRSVLREIDLWNQKGKVELPADALAGNPGSGTRAA